MGDCWGVMGGKLLVVGGVCLSLNAIRQRWSAIGGSEGASHIARVPRPLRPRSSGTSPRGRGEGQEETPSSSACSGPTSPEGAGEGQEEAPSVFGCAESTYPACAGEDAWSLMGGTLFSSHCLLPVAHCLLPIAHCPLPIAYCLLPIPYCLKTPTAPPPSTPRR
ncbi:MAG: hypothetical protein CMJ25_29630 [Phycisphaerae bacterium]|nr:hypothetical protein [Phycisphaerae bacterium]